MLVLTRGHEKSILIGDNVEVIVTGFMMMDENNRWVKVKPTFPVQVTLGIKAPRSVNIMRGEAVEKAVKDVDKMVEDRDNLCTPSHTDWRMPEQSGKPQPREDKQPRRERRRRRRTHH